MMTVLNAHINGKRIVLDDPLPAGLPTNTKVRVMVDAPEGNCPKSLQEIAEMAIDADLPRDFSTQFAHYTKGHPRK